MKKELRQISRSVSQIINRKIINTVILINKIRYWNDRNVPLTEESDGIYEDNINEIIEENCLLSRMDVVFAYEYIFIFITRITVLIITEDVSHAVGINLKASLFDNM